MRTTLEQLADRHKPALVDVVSWSSNKPEVWILDLLESVEKHQARAVVAAGWHHVGGNAEAITAAADLIMPSVVMEYVGYGDGGKR